MENEKCGSENVRLEEKALSICLDDESGFKPRRAGTYSRNSVMYLRLHLDHDQGLVS